MEYVLIFGYAAITFCLGLDLGIYRRESTASNEQRFAFTVVVFIWITIAMIGALDGY